MKLRRCECRWEDNSHLVGDLYFNCQLLTACTKADLGLARFAGALPTIWDLIFLLLPYGFGVSCEDI
jgi:hypothetical protein